MVGDKRRRGPIGPLHRSSCGRHWPGFTPPQRPGIGPPFTTANRLELEVTESIIINNIDQAVGILRRLKSFGIHISLDDFGTGYASLATLQAFPFDKLKIDRSFISQLGTGPQAAVIVRAVLSLGRSLGMGIVAEGVETHMQMRFLTEEACGEMQGYLFGKPRPIEDYAEAIRHSDGTARSEGPRFNAGRNVIECREIAARQTG